MLKVLDSKLKQKLINDAFTKINKLNDNLKKKQKEHFLNKFQHLAKLKSFENVIIFINLLQLCLDVIKKCYWRIYFAELLKKIYNISKEEDFQKLFIKLHRLEIARKKQFLSNLKILDKAKRNQDKKNFFREVVPKLIKGIFAIKNSDLLKRLKKDFLERLKENQRKNKFNSLAKKLLLKNGLTNLRTFFYRWKNFIELINKEKRVLLNLVKLYDGSNRLHLQRYLYKWLNFITATKFMDPSKFALFNKVII